MRPYFILIFSFFAISQCFRSDSVNDDRVAIFGREKRQTSNALTRKVDEVVRRIDQNGDGKISEAETYNLIVVVDKKKLSNETIAEEFKAMDLDHDGFLSASEIDPPRVQPANNGNTVIRPSPTSIKDDIFEAGDKDGNGKISLAEASEYFTQVVGIKLSKPALEAELRFLDKNHDGFLSASEIDPKESSIIF